MTKHHFGDLGLLEQVRTVGRPGHVAPLWGFSLLCNFLLSRTYRYWDLRITGKPDPLRAATSPGVARRKVRYARNGLVSHESRQFYYRV